MNKSNVSKEFSILDILSITDGRLMSRRHMDGVYDILGFLADASLFTHQLPHAMRTFQGYLKEQFPDLDISIPEINEQNFEVVVTALENRLGATRTVYRPILETPYVPNDDLLKGKTTHVLITE